MIETMPGVDAWEETILAALLMRLTEVDPQLTEEELYAEGERILADMLRPRDADAA